MLYCKALQTNNLFKLACILAICVQAACTTQPRKPPAPATSFDPIAEIALAAQQRHMQQASPVASASSVIEQNKPMLSSAELLLTASPPNKLKGRWLAVPWESLPEWDAADLTQVYTNVQRQCQWWSKRQDGQVWQTFCANLALEQNPKQAVQRHLQAYAQADEQGQLQGLATGYYEPIIQGSLQRQAAYQWPLYSLPTSDQQLPRAELTPADGTVHPSLAGRELVWLTDPIDVYIVQVQGSTRVQLPNGEIIRLAFAGSNGQAFTSISNPLIQAGAIKPNEASNQRLKQWAKTVSEKEVRQLLNSNMRFVFFKRDSTASHVGPAGSIGIPLTPQQSVAVDPNFTPMGSLLWLLTPALAKPQLMLAQDTGSAIRGVARVDIYFGTGDLAGDVASKTKHPSRLWVLWPKNSDLTSAKTP